MKLNLVFISLIWIFSGPADARTPFAFVRTSPKVTSGGGAITHGYFVLTTTARNGAMGGLSGADQHCLDDLTAADWKGKSTAGTLTAARVKSFFATSTTGNHLLPNTTYYFAITGSTTDGGASFTTDAQGIGPNDNALWNTADYFGTTTWSYWSSRATDGTTTTWANNTSGNDCAGWTSNANGSKGNYGHSNASTQSRWNSGATLGCSNTMAMICFVNPP